MEPSSRKSEMSPSRKVEGFIYLSESRPLCAQFIPRESLSTVAIDDLIKEEKAVQVPSGFDGILTCVASKRVRCCGYNSVYDMQISLLECIQTMMLEGTIRSGTGKDKCEELVLVKLANDAIDEWGIKGDDKYDSLIMLKEKMNREENEKEVNFAEKINLQWKHLNIICFDSYDSSDDNDNTATE